MDIERKGVVQVADKDSIHESLKKDIRVFLEKMKCLGRITDEEYHAGLYELGLEAYIAGSDFDIKNPVEL